MSAFADLPAPVQTAIIAVGALLVAISKIAPIISAIKGLGIVSSPESLGGLLTGTVVPAIGGALAAAAPVILVIAGIAATIAGVVLVIQNWDSITAAAKETIGPAIDAIGGFSAEWQKERLVEQLKVAKAELRGYEAESF